MKFTLTLETTEESSSTIIRNIYECFRMLGEASLIYKGIKSEDHITSINEIINIKDINTPRPIHILDNLRRLRHNINYYGYKPNLNETKETVLFAKSCFKIICNDIKKKII